MSTRTSLALVTQPSRSGDVDLHLYKEMHDDHVHLTIAFVDRGVHCGVDIVVPDPLVDAVLQVLQRSETK